MEMALPRESVISARGFFTRNKINSVSYGFLQSRDCRKMYFHFYVINSEILLFASISLRKTLILGNSSEEVLANDNLNKPGEYYEK